MTRPFLPLVVALGFLAACSGAGSASEPVGESAAAENVFPNDRAAYAFFVGKGLTGPQAAGIVGNFDVESGDDPTAVEAGGGGRGLAQWLAGGRWDTTAGDNAAAYARQQGESLESLQLQLEFTWFELSTFSDYGLARLKAATTVSAATTAFTSGFEGCSTCDETARIADAQAVLDAFGDETVGDGGSGGDDDDAAAVACVVTSDDGGADRDGVCLDTAACAAQGAYVSTPGFCPGAANIECCTPTTSDGGSVAPTDAGASEGGALGADGSSEPTTDSATDSGGCSLSAAASPRRTGLDPSLLVGLGLCVLTFRQRRPGKFRRP